MAGAFKNQDKVIRLQELVSHVDSQGHKRGRPETPEDLMPTPDNKANLEKVYTSTEAKLLQHMDRLQDAKKGVWRPINLQIAPTDLCNLECYFCSTHDRTGGKDVDQIPIDKLKTCIDDFVDVGPILSAEVTGGGDPTMYKQLPELLNHLYSRGVEVGMITNGLLLDKLVNNDRRGGQYLDAIQKLTWMRISLAFLDDQNYYSGNQKVDNIKVPPLSKDTVLGVSYVFSAHSDLDKLRRVIETKEQLGATYARIVPNCFSPEEQQHFKDTLAQATAEFPGAFGQSKDYDVHFACRIGRFKPFLNADGMLYQCSATPLYKGSFRAGKEWQIGRMEDVKQIWPSNLPTMDTSNCYAGKCFYSGQNKFLHSLELKVPHKNHI